MKSFLQYTKLSPVPIKTAYYQVARSRGGCVTARLAGLVLLRVVSSLAFVALFFAQQQTNEALKSNRCSCGHWDCSCSPVEKIFDCHKDC